ncbi:MAG: SRPBCC family protein [Solirubrobacteraceae bacterium]
MAAIHADMLIKAPADTVWTTIMDPHRLSDWVTIHCEVSEISRGPARVGYEMTQTIHLHGARFNVRWTLTACEPGRRAVWEGRGPARSKAWIEYRLTPEGDATRFRYSNEFRAPLGPLGAAAGRALVGGISEREANRSLTQLKELLEHPAR